jgi:uncharacterized protein with von Willebrand factor type A (vWA) domain
VQDFALFDNAFRLFWRQRNSNWPGTELRALGETRRTGGPEYTSELPPHDPEQDQNPERTYPVKRMAVLSYSQREGLWAKDFDHFTKDEISEAKHMMTTLSWRLSERESKRWIGGRGKMLDLKRAIRANMRYGGELIHLPTRRRKTKRRPLVLLCDVSGSMERYSRMLLHFIHALTGGAQLGHVESFVFSTQLTRITHRLTDRAADDIVPTLPHTISGYGGGTRIGNALRTFNIEWARRIHSASAIVLLISDGWDRGEPLRLHAEMKRLQRSCHRLVWLNPLLGAPDYLPLTRGMQAALPSIDDFLPVHNLASLKSLAQHLNSLQARRSARRSVPLSV